METKYKHGSGEVMKCYQIDFKDGARILVDADNEDEARQFAVEQRDRGYEAIEKVQILPN